MGEVWTSFLKKYVDDVKTNQGVSSALVSRIIMCHGFRITPPVSDVTFSYASPPPSIRASFLRLHNFPTSLPISSYLPIYPSAVFFIFISFDSWLLSRNSPSWRAWCFEISSSNFRHLQPLPYHRHTTVLPRGTLTFIATSPRRHRMCRGNRSIVDCESTIRTNRDANIIVKIHKTTPVLCPYKSGKLLKNQKQLDVCHLEMH